MSWWLTRDCRLPPASGRQAGDCSLSMLCCRSMREVVAVMRCDRKRRIAGLRHRRCRYVMPGFVGRNGYWSCLMMDTRRHPEVSLPLGSKSLMKRYPEARRSRRIHAHAANGSLLMDLIRGASSSILNLRGHTCQQSLSTIVGNFQHAGGQRE